MDFLLSQNNIWILILALVSGGLLLFPSLFKGRAGAQVSLGDAIRLFNQDNGLFVDIRPEAQFKAGHIPQSRNIPADTLESHAGSLPKDKPLIVVCVRGQIAKGAVKTLNKHGIDKAVSLEGGINAWIEGGFPIKKS